jgi:hypothetical protein
MSRTSVFAALCIFAGTACAGDWSAPVNVTHDDKVVLTYRAKWSGDFLVVRAEIQPGWHTFVMDNKERQQEKLAGKPSLGIEKSTEIVVSNGLSIAGGWLQSPPKDFSKPEIRWYTWGFEKDAVFATKARKTAAGPATVELRAQACFTDICKNIDVEMSVPLTPDRGGISDWDPKTLVRVR